MIVEGINVVRELISSRSHIDKILAEKCNNFEVNNIVDAARKLNIPVEIVDKELLEKINKGKTQGVLAYVPNFKYADVDDIKNITRTIEYLKEQGVWTYALEAGSKRIYDADFKYPTALIIGSEGKGVSRLVKETADEVLSLDMYGLVNSLNASCAGAIAIYEVVRQRRGE